MFLLGKLKLCETKINQLFKVGLTSGPIKYSQISVPLFEPPDRTVCRSLSSATGWKHEMTASDWLSVNDDQSQCEMSAHHHSVSAVWCKEER